MRLPLVTASHLQSAAGRASRLLTEASNKNHLYPPRFQKMWTKWGQLVRPIPDKIRSGLLVIVIWLQLALLPQVTASALRFEGPSLGEMRDPSSMPAPPPSTFMAYGYETSRSSLAPNMVFQLTLWSMGAKLLAILDTLFLASGGPSSLKTNH